jgi:hypothetical protein
MTSKVKILKKKYGLHMSAVQILVWLVLCSGQVCAAYQQSGATIRGHVRTDVGTLPPDAAVEVVDPTKGRGRVIRRVSVKPDGSYRIEGIPPGTYNLIAHDGSVYVPDGRHKKKSLNDRDDMEFNFFLSKATKLTSLKGKVEGLKGSSSLSHEIVIYAPECEGCVIAQAGVNAKGEYTVPDLVADQDYLIAVKTDGTLIASTPITTSSRVTLNLNLEWGGAESTLLARVIPDTEIIPLLKPEEILARKVDAQRILKSRLTLTASDPQTYVTVAAFDHESSEIQLLSVPKEVFLTRGVDMVLTSSKGKRVRLQVVRPNYVNTIIMLSDPTTGKPLTPLLVEFPIEKFGRLREMAYYTSAHPSLLSFELIQHGQTYIRNMLNLAAKRLKDKGKVISPNLVDIAERLCVVEHVDSGRFRTEDHKKLYEEVYALFALNGEDTYRYSVSSAGAGGMVQMIPSTYQMVRRMHPDVGLNPDFVAGMRNHGNALEAMLLYIQDIWTSLSSNADIALAIKSGFATQAEIIVAAYNSNPDRLPIYVRRGGASWRSLLPRETQLYLRIYEALTAQTRIESSRP